MESCLSTTGVELERIFSNEIDEECFRKALITLRKTNCKQVHSEILLSSMADFFSRILDHFDKLRYYDLEKRVGLNLDKESKRVFYSLKTEVEKLIATLKEPKEISYEDAYCELAQMLRSWKELPKDNGESIVDKGRNMRRGKNDD